MKRYFKEGPFFNDCFYYYKYILPHTIFTEVDERVIACKKAFLAVIH